MYEYEGLEDLSYLFKYKRVKLKIENSVKLTALKKVAEKELENKFTSKFWNNYSSQISRNLWIPSNDTISIRPPALKSIRNIAMLRLELNQIIGCKII